LAGDFEANAAIAAGDKDDSLRAFICVLLKLFSAGEQPAPVDINNHAGYKAVAH
jgi:hypothetical protein